MKKLRKKRRRRRSVSIIVSLLLLLTILGIVVVWNTTLLKDDSAGNAGEIDQAYKNEDKNQKKVVNFLVAGIDDDPTMRDTVSQTDVLMVVSCDLEQKKVHVLQIPRDLYVDNKADAGKINGIYANSPDDWPYNGLNGIIRLIYESLSLPIDHYITVKMDGFRELVDHLGGITMEVPVTIFVDGITIPKGRQLLNGKQALAVVRGRKMYKTADFGRMDTQALFLAALATHIQTLSTIEMTQMAPLLIQLIKTDMSFQEILEMALLFQKIPSQNITLMTLPSSPILTRKTPYGERTGRQLDVVSIDKEMSATVLNEYFQASLTQHLTPDNILLHQLHDIELEKKEWVKTFDSMKIP